MVTPGPHGSSDKTRPPGLLRRRREGGEEVRALGPTAAIGARQTIFLITEVRVITISYSRNSFRKSRSDLVEPPRDIDCAVHYIGAQP